MVSKAEIRSLVEAEADPAVSIYLPVHAALPDRRKNVIRLRNLLRQVEEALAARGADPEPLLDRARRAFDPEPPVEGRETRGLAIFLSAEGLTTLPLPGAPREQVRLGAGFDVLPLLPFVDAERFFVLSLDQAAPTLLRGDRAGLETLASGVMERSLAEIRGATELPAELGYHSSGPGGGGAAPGRPAAYRHSQGESPEDYQQTELEQFAHGIARAAEQRLKGQSAPLVPVGEPNLLGMFRKHCRYPHLTAKAVAKSPAGLAEAELHRLAREVAAEHLDSPAREAAARAAEGHNRGDGNVSTRLREIREAAEQGRVATLLLARAANGAALRAAEDEDARALAAETVRLTLGHGGEVMTVGPDALPGGAAMAALLRF